MSRIDFGDRSTLPQRSHDDFEVGGAEGSERSVNRGRKTFKVGSVEQRIVSEDIVAAGSTEPITEQNVLP
jgi:hypothetical protein